MLPLTPLRSSGSTPKEFTGKTANASSNAATLLKLNISQLCERTRKPILQSLAEIPDVTQNIPESCSFLDIAATHNKTCLIQKILQAGCDVNLQRPEENTPLHWSVVAQANEASFLLLECGADPNLPGQNGKTALHMLANHRPNYPEKQSKINQIGRALLQAGADPNIRDKEGDTPLHLIARQGEAEVLETILERANPLLLSQDGQTPLKQMEEYNELHPSNPAFEDHHFEIMRKAIQRTQRQLVQHILHP